eukprot:jgi/Botrbrau1/2037/Bobra.0047s0017.1
MVSDAAVEGVSGALGGIVALVATYPLLTVTTLQATRSSNVTGSVSDQFTVPFKKKPGTLSDVAEVISKHGWTGLYRGLRVALIGTALSQGIYFYLYSNLRQLAVKRNRKLHRLHSNDITVAESLVVAFLAGCGNVLLTNPFWVIVTRMQASEKHASKPDEKGSGHGPLACTRDLYHESGVLGFWKGVLPSLIMVSNPTVNYMLYEWLQGHLHAIKRTAGRGPVRSSAAETFVVSALAKLGATLATYPLQVVKSRLQNVSKHSASDRNYTGTADAIIRIYQSEGFAGFFHGLRTKLAQSILAAALLMAVKEELTNSTRALLNVGVSTADD